MSYFSWAYRWQTLQLIKHKTIWSFFLIPQSRSSVCLLGLYQSLLANDMLRPEKRWSFCCFVLFHHTIIAQWLIYHKIPSRAGLRLVSLERRQDRGCVRKIVEWNMFRHIQPPSHFSIWDQVRGGQALSRVAELVELMFPSGYGCRLNAFFPRYAAREPKWVHFIAPPTGGARSLAFGFFFVAIGKVMVCFQNTELQ